MSKNIYTEALFGRVRLGDKKVINLGTALDNEEFALVGSVMFSDTGYTGDSIGIAYIRFNSKDNPAHVIKAGSGFKFKNYAFSKVFITCAAQSGNKLNLFYGDNADIIPPNQDITSIGSVAQVGEVVPYTLNTLYEINDALTTLRTIVAPAANTNGIRVDRCNVMAGNSPAQTARFMSKASAPASATDVTARTIGGIYLVATYDPWLNNLPYIIPAGEGLYFQGSTANMRWAEIDYEVLS